MTIDFMLKNWAIILAGLIISAFIYAVFFSSIFVDADLDCSEENLGDY